MQKMKLMVLATMLMAIMSLTSCNNDDNDAFYYGYATVRTDLATNSFWFVDDAGKTYYPDLSSMSQKYDIKDSKGDDKNGRRVYITFTMRDDKKQGYDYHIQLDRVVDILTKGVTKCSTAAEVDSVGDDLMEVTAANLGKEWLDVSFNLNVTSSATHMISLIDNQATPPAGLKVPDGYIYLEIRQKASKTEASYGTIGAGNVAFKLPDEYNPAKLGKKGIYLRVHSLSGDVNYYKIDLGN